METRRIKARNGEELTFSVVGEGTGPLGDFYELLDEKTSIATIEQALASGVKVFDSSPHYGNGLAEARMGAGLRRAKRDEILVSTKIGRIMDPFTKPPKPRSDVVSPGFAGGHPHAPRFDYSYDGAMRSIEHSLLRMGLDRVDIVLIHDCDVWTHGKEEAPGRFKEAMEGAISALDKLRNEKVIKAIGFGINEADTCVKFAKAGDFDVAMMAGRYTLIDQTGLTEFLPLALEKNMGVMLAGVFNSGILATGSGPNAKYDYTDAPKAVVDKVKAIEEICKKHKVTLRQVGDPIRARPSRCRVRRARRGEAGGGQVERPRRDGRDPGEPVVGPQVGQASGQGRADQGLGGAQDAERRPRRSGDRARAVRCALGPACESRGQRAPRLAKAVASGPIWLAMKFPPEFLDEIRARLPVSEVAGTRVKLRKEGREWRGLSPFTAEKTPSFFVNDQKGFFHDFSSGKHGDAFAFLMETEGLTFPEAVERLAGMAGLPMPRLSQAEAAQDKKRASLLDVVAMAARLFEANLQQPIGARARGYLADRGLGSPVQQRFGLGYASPSASRCATRSRPRASAPRR